MKNPLVNAGLLLLLASALIRVHAQIPELVAQVGHTQAPHWLKFGLQDRILISAGDDNKITVWDIAQQRLILTIPFVAAAGDGPSAFSFSLHGTFIAVRTGLETISVWSLQSGQLAGNFRAPSSPPGACTRYERLSISDDGRHLGRAYSDQCENPEAPVAFYLQVWDVSAGRERKYNLGSFSAADFEFSPDGRRLALILHETQDKHRVEVWDAVSGSKLFTVNDSERRIAGEPGYFSRDGKLLFVAEGNSLHVRDAERGKVLVTVPAKNENAERIEIVEASDDHKILAAVVRGLPTRTQTRDVHTLKLWRIEDGREIRSSVISHSPFDASALSISPDSQFVFCRLGALEDKQLKSWNIATGDERFTIQADNYSNVAFSRNGRSFAVGDRNLGIDLYGSDDGRKTKTLTGHNAYVSLERFSSRGKHLITSSADPNRSRPSVGVWGLHPNGFQRSLPGRFVGSSDDGNRIVTQQEIEPDVVPSAQEPTEHRSAITIWDAATGAKVRSFVGNIPDSPVNGRMTVQSKTGAILIDLNSETMISEAPAPGMPSPNGKLVASSDPEQGTTDIYSVAEGRKISTLRWTREKDGSEIAFSWASGFSPDSLYFASSINLGHTSNVIEVRSVNTGQLWRTLPVDLYQTADYHHNFVFSSSGKTLIAGYATAPQVWDLTTGTAKPVEGTCEARAGLRYSDSVMFSPLEKYLVDIAIGDRNNICLWEVTRESGMSLRFKAMYDGSAAAISPDDRVLATVGDDQIVRMWDIASGKLLGNVVPFDAENWLVTAPDGRFDGTPSAWNKIFWRFPGNVLDSAVVESFFNEFYSPGLLTEIYSGKLPPILESIAEKDRRPPRIEIVLPDKKPELAGLIAERTVNLRLNISEQAGDLRSAGKGSGAQDVRLFRNGSLSRVWRGDVLKGKSSITLEATVPIVAGENKFTAYAFNHDNIKSSDATLTVTGDASLKRPGTLYVLAIGVNRYSNRQYNLKYAVADADEFGEEIKRQQAGLNNYERVEVTSLTDANATKNGILESLSRLAASVQPEDALIIFFAGHGTAQGKRFYLIPHDLGYLGSRTRLNRIGLQNILTHSISDEELQKAVEGIDAGQLLLVIDACNSGQALEAEEKRRGPMNSKGLAQLAYEKGMYVMTAAQSYQAALEAAKFGHGYLTHALVVEGLKKGSADREPKNGAIDIREWLNFATEEVPKMQEKKSREALRGRSRYVFFVGDGRREGFPKTEAGIRDNIQRPRVFYRRELEANPFVVGTVGSAPR